MLVSARRGGNFDLVRAKEGGLDVQVFSVWSDYTGGFGLANRQIDSLDALIRRHPDKIAKVRTASELKSAVKQGKMAALFGVEGGHMIENSIENLEALAQRGMTYMTLTWNNSTPWSSSAYEETFKRDSLKQIGLSDLGKQIIKRMNELGVIVDLSHVGETTFYDAIRASTKPVMASHSSAYVLNAHQRNLKDDQIKAIAKTGGVVFVNFYTGFLDSTYSGKQKQYHERHKAELSALTAKYNSRAKASEEINTKYRQEIEDMRAPLSLLNRSYRSHGQACRS
jgi:membrane dipeptidase